MKTYIIACLHGEFNYMYLCGKFRLQIDIYMHTKKKSVYYRNNLFFNKYLLRIFCLLKKNGKLGFSSFSDF